MPFTWKREPLISNVKKHLIWTGTADSWSVYTDVSMFTDVQCLKWCHTRGQVFIIYYPPPKDRTQRTLTVFFLSHWLSPDITVIFQFIIAPLQAPISFCVSSFYSTSFWFQTQLPFLPLPLLFCSVLVHYLTTTVVTVDSLYPQFPTSLKNFSLKWGKKALSSFNSLWFRISAWSYADLHQLRNWPFMFPSISWVRRVQVSFKWLQTNNFKSILQFLFCKTDWLLHFILTKWKTFAGFKFAGGKNKLDNSIYVALQYNSRPI